MKLHKITPIQILKRGERERERERGRETETETETDREMKINSILYNILCL